MYLVQNSEKTKLALIRNKKPAFLFEVINGQIRMVDHEKMTLKGLEEQGRSAMPKLTALALGIASGRIPAGTIGS